GINDGTAPIPYPLIGTKFNDPYVSPDALARLQALSEPHAYFAQAVSPPFDDPAYPRNYTSYNEEGLSVGGMEIDAKVVGGPAANVNQFVPAALIWSTEAGGVAWMLHYPTSSSISAIATSTNLTITYPPSRAFPDDATSSKVMTFLFSGITGVSLPSDFLANGISADLSGIRLSVSGNAASGNRMFVYGSGTINDVSYYNLTYVIPELGAGEEARIVFGFEKV
ncbi:hypothetical protein BDZ89DRAFT_1049334, partial [Hymenopellis radicata]